MRLILAVLALTAALDSRAFFLFPVEAPVIEYRNNIIGHYFMTADAQEIAGIDAGAAGPGWERTGFGFTAISPGTSFFCGGCVPVQRFYGTPGLGPNSHFYSEMATEADGLRRPGTGWSFEKIAFYAPVPDAAGQCPAAYPVPVYRLYNGRWMFNDSNHRYVTDASMREAMIAQGWADEGARFCAANKLDIATESYAIGVYKPEDILPSAQCEDDAVRTGSCMAINNLPIPREPQGSTFFGDNAFTRLTGMVAQAYVPAGSPPLAAQGPFVQLSGSVFGIHVVTAGRAPNSAASINPLFQFPSEGSDDSRRFYPWRSTHTFETQLAIRWSINVQKILTAAGEGHHAYGHPTLEFIDRASGRHLYFTVLSYGTIGGGDYLAPDVGTGKVIVGTEPRADTPYGRNFGATWIRTESGYDAGTGPARGGTFDFRVDRSEFARIVASARTIDPLLSTNPGDYYLDNFHFNNEAVGDAEIGLNLSSLRLDVLRR